MGLINFGLGLARGILNVVGQATGSRGVALAAGIVGTIGASFANIGGARAGTPAGQLLGVGTAQTANQINVDVRLAGALQGGLPGARGGA